MPGRPALEPAGIGKNAGNQPIHSVRLGSRQMAGAAPYRRMAARLGRRSAGSATATRLVTKRDGRRRKLLPPLITTEEEAFDHDHAYLSGCHWRRNATDCLRGATSASAGCLPASMSVWRSGRLKADPWAHRGGGAGKERAG